jgi:hypothetical protein
MLIQWYIEDHFMMFESNIKPVNLDHKKGFNDTSIYIRSSEMMLESNINL